MSFLVHLETRTTGDNKFIFFLNKIYEPVIKKYALVS